MPMRFGSSQFFLFVHAAFSFWFSDSNKSFAAAALLYILVRMSFWLTVSHNWDDGQKKNTKNPR